MKLLKITIDGLPHFQNVLDIDFITQQRVSDDNKEQLYNVFSNVYVNQAISFIGINASGKTTILKAISFVMNMLNNESINKIVSKDIFDDLDNNKKVIIKTYFCEEYYISKLETFIEKKIDSIDGSEKLIIFDESLYSKDTGKIRAKKNMFNTDGFNLMIKRDENDKYLMEDVSIIVAVNKKNETGLFLQDMSELTNYNILSMLGNFPKELLIFLDPSIEYLKCEIYGKKVDIRLKFYDKDEIAINHLAEINKYLSSGTIKGLGVFMNALFVFKKGGYLIIDEIENHFNREIVATLIRFFMDPYVNKNGATIIFSTHYSELLDEFDRNDSIYIVKNKKGIIAQNLSNILKRNDIKKSEVYDSDFLEGTVPAYEAYIALKKVLINSY